MAIGVLDVYDKNTRESVVDVLVIRYLKELGMDCLELAHLCKCRRFLSNSTVQRVLDYIWQDTRDKPKENTNQDINEEANQGSTQQVKSFRLFLAM